MKSEGGYCTSLLWPRANGPRLGIGLPSAASLTDVIGEVCAEWVSPWQ
jgi:hypothetical protein